MFKYLIIILVTLIIFITLGVRNKKTKILEHVHLYDGIFSNVDTITFINYIDSNLLSMDSIKSQIVNIKSTKNQGFEFNDNTPQCVKTTIYFSELFYNGLPSKTTVTFFNNKLFHIDFRISNVVHLQNKTKINQLLNKNSDDKVLIHTGVDSNKNLYIIYRDKRLNFQFVNSLTKYSNY